MTLYAVINDEERTRFEKETHLPYGYGSQDVYLTHDYFNALAYFNTIPPHIKTYYVVEKIECGIAEKIFPVVSFTNNEFH
ncbi:MAG TPA: hypothetical protein P5293_01295 [Bacteroidales bacterium]|nr:hypothetical protein [Bacteroidales bacterium]